MEGCSCSGPGEQTNPIGVGFPGRGRQVLKQRLIVNRGAAGMNDMRERRKKSVVMKVTGTSKTTFLPMFFRVK